MVRPLRVATLLPRVLDNTFRRIHLPAYRTGIMIDHNKGSVNSQGADLQSDMVIICGIYGNILLLAIFSDKSSEQELGGDHLHK